jgi:hypothetical protein
MGVSAGAGWGGSRGRRSVCGGWRSIGVKIRKSARGREAVWRKEIKRVSTWAQASSIIVCKMVLIPIL